MLVRSALIWLGILVLASLNGAVRDLLLSPRLGDPAARAISTLVLCALVVLVTWLSIRWIGPRSAAAALTIGGLWLVLTLAFEFLAGHYLFRESWATLLEDYDVRRGRIWVLVPVTTLLTPVWLARARGLLPPAGRRRQAAA
jgi:hypothetical protein